MKLGVIWYLVPDEIHTNDGKHISYLNPTPQNYRRFRECDPELYDTLQQLVDAGQRNVGAVERSNILGSDTTYYSRPLTYEGIQTSSQRLAFREAWMSEAMEAVKDCDLVFVDPDNGLECGIGKQNRSGVKYAYHDEVNRLVQAGKGVLIYHHLSRRGNAVVQATTQMSRMAEHFKRPLQRHALQYHRGSARLFLLIPEPGQYAQVRSAVSSFLESYWATHFTDLTDAE